jgi:endonuclease/exonuclease/phosphatase family metal-dependent hydrolase
VKIIDWNIKTDPLRRWQRRQDVFKEVLLPEQPDIFCAQEALKHQVDFFAKFLEGYKYIGNGREDGKEKGEYNPIFYSTATLELLEYSQFWLTSTPDVPSKEWDMYPRICTWGKFKEKTRNREFYIFNTHLPLVFNPSGRKKALGVIAQKIHSLPKAPMILTGDFNSIPQSATWKSIYALGFQKNPHVKITHAPVLHIPLVCFDAIFTTPEFIVQNYRLLKHLRASDHFGVAAEIELE